MRIAHNLIVDYFRRNNKMPIVPNRPENDVLDNLKFPDENAEHVIMRKQTNANNAKLFFERPVQPAQKAYQTDDKGSQQKSPTKHDYSKGLQENMLCCRLNSRNISYSI